MKIPIHDSEQSLLGKVQIKITDAGSGQQRITVRIPSLKVFDIIRPRPARTPTLPQQPNHASIKKSPADSTSNVPQTPAKKTQRALPNEDARPRGIEISFIIPVMQKLPSLSTFKGRLRTTPRRNLVIAGVFCLILVALPIAGLYLLFRPTSATTNSTFQAGPPQLPKGTPNFSTILPTGKNIADYGGWTRISPPDRAAVYGYADTIGNVHIDVSEQQLPTNFQTDTATAIEKLAKDFGAANTLTAGHTTVYIGTSINGPQSVIFTEKGLLVLIKSVSPINNAAWTSYINALR